MVQAGKRERELNENELETPKVKFRSLYSDPENRTIRMVVDTPTGVVTIFEPTNDDIREIMQLDDMVAAFNQENSEENELDISGTTIMKELIPRLTDLDLDDMTDDEITEVINNLTVEGNVIMACLTSIVTHIYTIMLMNFENNLDLNNMAKMSEKMSDKAFSMYVNEAAKTDEGRRQMQEINKQASKVISLRDKTNADKSDKTAEADMKDATVLDPDNYQKSIEAQIDRFEDVDQ